MLTDVLRKWHNLGSNNRVASTQPLDVKLMRRPLTTARATVPPLAVTAGGEVTSLILLHRSAVRTLPSSATRNQHQQQPETECHVCLHTKQYDSQHSMQVPFAQCM